MNEEKHLMQIEELSINFRTREVQCNNTLIKFSPAESIIFFELAKNYRNNNQLGTTTQKLADTIYGQRFTQEPLSNVQSIITSIRKKMKKLSGGKYWIFTTRGDVNSTNYKLGTAEECSKTMWIKLTKKDREAIVNEQYLSIELLTTKYNVSRSYILYLKRKHKKAFKA